ncbi:MAG: hypothetical protein WDO71_03525 [Bacteroidota bacterium]
MAEIPMEEAIETTSTSFKNKDDYATVVYLKTAIWMYITEISVGTDKFNQVIKSYYDKWKFKHPYPEDLKAEFELQLNVKMDGLFNLLNKKGKFE